jgi:hypothetical protein
MGERVGMSSENPTNRPPPGISGGEAQRFRKWDALRTEDGRSHYEVQTEILDRAKSEQSLDCLLRLMRQRQEAAIYFSGTRLDNDHCLGSHDIGMLVSVMPEDGIKAAIPGYHPGSTEVYVTFQGEVTLEVLEQGLLLTKIAQPSSVVVLPPGQCHRVRSEPGRPAASLIVKTNLQHKPSVVRCESCGYFSNPQDCPLHRSWRSEESS